MLRWQITSQDGLQFQIDGLALPSPQPPEWGVNPVITGPVDVSQEYADITAAKQAKRDALAAIKAMKGKGSFTPAELQALCKALVDILR